MALALVGLWLIPAVLSGGQEYRAAILWTQSAGRIAGSFAHARPWWFFAALLPLALFPWVFLPGLWRAAARADWREPGLRLCLVWAGSALVLFSLISGKQAHYLMPELAAAALVVARLTREAPPLRLVFAVLPVGAAAAAGIAAASGLVPLGEAAGRLVQPTSVLLAWAALLLATCWLAVRWRGLSGGLVLSLGLVLSSDLLFGLTEAREIYDTHRIAEAIAPFEAEGIAVFGPTYHAEFNFAGRLTRPVATPEDTAALAAWQASHPGGVIVGSPDKAAPAWTPRLTLLFRNASYAVWHVADAPHLRPDP